MESSRLRAAVQAFIRGFGLLQESRTPCGQALPLSHAHALGVLLEHERRGTVARQKDLADALGLDKSSVARLCRRMEDAGHVKQERADDDGRVRRVGLTAKGMKAARQVETASQLRFNQVLDAISELERPRVLAALDVLNDAVAELTRQETAL